MKLEEFRSHSKEWQMGYLSVLKDAVANLSRLLDDLSMRPQQEFRRKLGEELMANPEIEKFRGKSGREIMFDAQRYVWAAVKAGNHFNGEIGKYVAENDPDWRWKTHTVIGFVLSEMVKKGTLTKTPYLKSTGHYVARFDLPPETPIVYGSPTALAGAKEVVKESKRP